MIEKRIKLSKPPDEGFLIRTIREKDIELLRLWKNSYRDRFFFNEIITPDMQIAWFESYQLRQHDFMLVIENVGDRIGCLGFRRLEDRVDLYNIIMADEASLGRGYMRRAVDLLCEEIRFRYPNLPIMVSVLRTNPALKWYLRVGFVLIRENETYFELVREF